MMYMCADAGYLSAGDSSAPGNYAFLDLVAALHWIKENIHAFGGDPYHVTLMGHGYGAALVNLLIVSPVTKGDSPVCLLGQLGNIKSMVFCRNSGRKL